MYNFAAYATLYNHLFRQNSTMECCWSSRCFAITDYWADLFWFDRHRQISWSRTSFTVNLFRNYSRRLQNLAHSFLFLHFSSFYGRIENSIGRLPRLYYHSKPHIACTHTNLRVYHHEAPKESYNWIIGSKVVEEIESKTGKLKNYDRISRVSKRSFKQKFSEIKKKLPEIDWNRGDKRLTYADEKELAFDFQVHKITVCLIIINTVDSIVSIVFMHSNL